MSSVSLETQFPSDVIKVIRTKLGLSLLIISVSGSRNCCRVLHAHVQYVLNIWADITDVN